jgi:hypothetical protein
MHTNAYRRPLSPRPHPLHTHSRTHLGKNISARKRVRATDHPFPLSNQQMSNVSWLFSLPCAFPLSLPDARIVFVCERGGEVVVVQAGSSTAQDREKYLYRWFPLRKLFTGCSSLLIFCIMVPDISCCHYPYPYPCIAAGTAAGAATTAAGGSAADAGAAVTAGTIDLGHHHSASLRGTGTKGAAPVPPVPRTGPSMGGCLHACVLSQREGRSAIPPAAGTACMIRMLTLGVEAAGAVALYPLSLSRPNYSHARTQIPVPSLSYRCIAVESGCSLHTSDPVDYWTHPPLWTDNIVGNGKVKAKRAGLLSAHWRPISSSSS